VAEVAATAKRVRVSPQQPRLQWARAAKAADVGSWGCVLPVQRTRIAVGWGRSLGSRSHPPSRSEWGIGANTAEFPSVDHVLDAGDPLVMNDTSEVFAHSHVLRVLDPAHATAVSLFPLPAVHAQLASVRDKKGTPFALP